MSKNGKNAKAAFFEISPIDREYVSEHLPDLELLFFGDDLDKDNVELVKDVSILSGFLRSGISAAIIDRLPQLKMIATRSTGYEHIDLQACAQRGIVVSNVPYYGENTVAEHTFALILALSRNLHKAVERTMRADFSLSGLIGFDLKGKTLGVVGAGAIGLHVIRIAKGFGMNVLAHDVRANHLLAEVLGFTYVSVDELLRQSDIVTLHAPLTRETHHLIDREALQRMKRGSLLINTARGGLIDTAALTWALDEGILAGAGLDVLEGEELIQDEEHLLAAPTGEDTLKTVLRNQMLLRRANVIITPHIAFYSREALQRIIETTVENIRSFLAGQQQNTVPLPLPNVPRREPQRVAQRRVS